MEMNPTAAERLSAECARPFTGHGEPSGAERAIQSAYYDGVLAERARIIAALCSKEAEDCAYAGINELFNTGIETDDRVAALAAIRAVCHWLAKQDPKAT